MGAKEIIILGTGSTRVQCPYDCEVWGVNGIYSEIEIRKNRGIPARLDKLFVTDYLFSPQGHLHFDIDRVNRITKEFNTQVISLRKLKLGKYEIKTTRYPFQRIVEKLDSNYFTSTICYMLAYALDRATYKEDGILHLKYPLKLRLYGVDMHGKGTGFGDNEYMLQKGGVEFWLGYAKGLKVENFVAPGGAILTTPQGLPYGFRREINFRAIDPFNLLGRYK